ncbi:hypothetical protein INT47_002062 [Mucor saturninus]|uniref:Velvet domain-containing protein n=1 Tax=Mucor saturninus TaxID=64648 RepID=A0A8H7R2D5_9FUNG|nr:hypothetical protein INT47_002062 [Mucor saturninus]
MLKDNSSSNSGGCTYRFIESSLAALSPEIDYDVEIRQEPKRAKISLINERDRRPIEPPPILQLHWKNCTEEELKKCLQSPFYFTVANLVTEKDPETPLLPAQNYLSGTTVSSLYRLRDVDNSDGGFFVFGDLAVKKEGKFKLRFSLFEIVEGQVQNRRTILSDTFTVFLPKHFPGPVEPTFLSRTFSDQGVKMRIRKEHRLQTRKRKAGSADTQIKRCQSKRACNVFVNSPSYAEPSNTQKDVFFGRWQSSSTHTTPPPMNEEFDYKDLTNKFRYQQPDPVQQAFPSPESTIHTRIKSWSSNHSSPWTPIMNNVAESPPPVTMHLPPPTVSLVKYHTCPDSSNHTYDRLPTPPISMADLHQKATGHHTWGARLPPLRAIMDHVPQSSLLPLLLPPPSLMIDQQRPRYL